MVVQQFFGKQNEFWNKKGLETQFQIYYNAATGTDQIQHAVSHKIASRPYAVKTEVPRRSVLGPLLFLICIDNLSRETNFVTRLSSDESVLFLLGPNLALSNEAVSFKLNFFCSKTSGFHTKQTQIGLSPKFSYGEKIMEISNCI